MQWDYFDSIYCINLYSREDKLKKSSTTFRKLNIPVQYYRVNKHPTSGAQGCYESHLNIIRNAYNKGCRNVLIFEDDAIDSSYYDEKLVKIAIDFLKTTPDWEIFYFGHQPDILFNSSNVVSNNIMKTHSTLSHAYAVSRKYMKKILLSGKEIRPYDGTPIDKIYMINNNAYALYPMIFYQDMMGSDIETSKPIRGMRFFECWAYYVNYSVIEVVIIFILVLILAGVIFINYL